MLNWIKSVFKPPQPAGPEQIIRDFALADKPIASGSITVEGDGWRIECQTEQSVRVFEVADPGVEQCMLTYRAKMKTEDLQAKAYLEMWCRIPGKGEFFSKGLHHAVAGTNDWASYEIPFYLKKGQRPDLIKLNIVFKGAGTAWLKAVELVQTPLRS